MRHTVRLCRNFAGYFPTLKPVGRSVRVYWSTRVSDHSLAVHVLGLAHEIAQRLTKRDHERTRPDNEKARCC